MGSGVHPHRTPQIWFWTNPVELAPVLEYCICTGVAADICVITVDSSWGFAWGQWAPEVSALLVAGWQDIHQLFAVQRLYLASVGVFTVAAGDCAKCVLDVAVAKLAG